MSSIIFDFDGTIADSLPVILHLFYKWSDREPFSASELETLRNMTAKDVLKSIGVPLWRAPGLLARGRKDFTKHIEEIPIFKGIPEVIADLHHSGHKLYLMSSNSHHNVQKYLKLHKIDQYFYDISGSTGLFNKSAAMNKIIKHHRIKKADCYSIGDESRDVDAAKKSGINSIAVTWGYNGEKILKEHQPDFLVSKPQQITTIIKA